MNYFPRRKALIAGAFAALTLFPNLSEAAGKKSQGGQLNANTATVTTGLSARNHSGYAQGPGATATATNLRGGAYLGNVGVDSGFGATTVTRPAGAGFTQDGYNSANTYVQTFGASVAGHSALAKGPGATATSTDLSGAKVYGDVGVRSGFGTTTVTVTPPAP